MKIKCLMAMMACVGFAAGVQANPVTINFQDHGTGDLGAGAITFTEGGASITAEGFSGPSTPVDLYAKFTSGDPTETGLGLVNDPSGEHEIIPGSFIQLSLPPGPAGSTLTLLVAGSIQAGESAVVSHNTTSGTLAGGTLISGGGVSGDVESFTITATTGFIDITAGTGNVLLDSVVVVVPEVPDSGMSIALLGSALTALGFARRKLMA